MPDLRSLEVASDGLLREGELYAVNLAARGLLIMWRDLHGDDVPIGVFGSKPKKKKRLEFKDRELLELKNELESIFNRLHGVEEVAGELDEIVEPFIEPVPENKERLEFEDQITHINFDALATQVETADKLRQLARRIEEQRQDEEDAIALLLLMP